MAGDGARTQIVWLRRDLRLSDQPAFHAAAAAGPVLAVYVLDDERAGDWAWGGASRWWLHHSLDALDHELKRRGGRIVLRRGDAVRHLVAIAREVEAGAIHALRHHEPWWTRAEADLAGALPDGVELCLHDGNYLTPPGSVLSKTGTPYRIYTPFMRAVMEHMPPGEPLAPPRLSAPSHRLASDDLADWQLLPAKPDWAGGLRAEWTPGEGGAAKRLEAFADEVSDYEHARNLPSVEGSSRLSPHLAHGEISPRQVWHGLRRHSGVGADTFRKELIWRDYAANVIAQAPDYATKGHNPAFRHLKWRTSAADLKAWQRGRTGYPIVDAGMRQLWHSGWMHNRVRMIAASFLVKHLLIDWRVGERWFWDTLVDADYANNAVNWQWIAGSGMDANLFSRIMAPLSQSARFDAAGYIRQWVPELAKLTASEIHDPLWRPAGYPEPIIGHREGRERALAAWQAARG